MSHLQKRNVFTRDLMFGKKRNMTDSEILDMMKVGTRVVRGKKWHWRWSQDGSPPGEGTIIEAQNEWAFYVRWDEDNTDRYNPDVLDLA
ncbi:putative HERC2-like protein 3 isoform X3 [Asterias rubens]|uniref:putative HERC2-like protein 3 isoform X3 n=1 Tax=Asterias rubens TaxID=7604 RepID=UPI001455B995|nr:putative HERC2-like protein 3 isoform X3 [Asterias rubens]